MKTSIKAAVATAAVAITATVATILVPVTPDPVIVLYWDPSSDPDVTNYTVYYGVKSGVYTNKVSVGNVTTTKLTGEKQKIKRKVKYYIAATATDSKGLESKLSNETTIELPEASSVSSVPAPTPN